MTIKKFVNDNYQVTKIVGIGSNASAIVLKESEINDEVRKELLKYNIELVV